MVGPDREAEREQEARGRAEAEEPCADLERKHLAPPTGAGGAMIATPRADLAREAPDPPAARGEQHAERHDDDGRGEQTRRTAGAAC